MLFPPGFRLKQEQISYFLYIFAKKQLIKVKSYTFDLS